MAITSPFQSVSQPRNPFERRGWKFDATSKEYISPYGARIPIEVLNMTNPDRLVELIEASDNMGRNKPDGGWTLKDNHGPHGQVIADHYLDALNYGAPAFQEPKPKKRSPYEKLAVRMDLPSGETFPFQHCHIVETTDQVHVLIVVNDQAVLLHDDKSLFPSDALLASIRLLQ